MNRTIGKLILIALSALAMAACETNPSKPEPRPEPVVQKSTVDLMLEIRKKELEIERTEQMAWIKFATESNSELAKGFVMGRSAAKAPASAAGSTTQTILQAQAQADETALRREELAEKRSGWNKFLQAYDRFERVVFFSQGLRFRKFEIESANSQNRYTLDTVRGAQRDGFNQGSSAALGGVTAGSGAALGGLSAGTSSTDTAPTE